MLIIAEGCPDWSLTPPGGGDKACSGVVSGANGSGFACELTCPGGADGSDFVFDSIMLYLCTFGGSWFPSNEVPDCSGKIK